MKTHNPMAVALKNFKASKVKAKKGRGSYQRKAKHKLRLA